MENLDQTPQQAPVNNKSNKGEFALGFVLTLLGFLFLTPFIAGLFFDTLQSFNLDSWSSYFLSLVGIIVVYILLLFWAKKRGRRALVRGSLMAVLFLVVVPILLFGACMLAFSR